LTSEEIEQKRDMIRAKKLEEQSGATTTTTSVVSSETTPHDSSKQEHEQENIAEASKDEKHEFLAFARVFSGTLKKGQTLFILSPKHSPEDFLLNENVRIS